MANERQHVIKKTQHFASELRHTTVYIQEDYRCIQEDQRRALFSTAQRSYIYLLHIQQNYRSPCTRSPARAYGVIIGLIKITTISIPAGYQRNHGNITILPGKSAIRALFTHAWVMFVNYLIKWKKTNIRRSCTLRRLIMRVVFGSSVYLLIYLLRISF